jgi:hypothetical protein
MTPPESQDRILTPPLAPQRYNLQFGVVYIAEAHATDEWPISSARYTAEGKAVSLAQTRSTEDRCSVASQCLTTVGFLNQEPVCEETNRERGGGRGEEEGGLDQRVTRGFIKKRRGRGEPEKRERGTREEGERKRKRKEGWIKELRGVLSKREEGERRGEEGVLDKRVTGMCGD